MKLPVSVVVITKNESLNIERCLRSVTFANDIVILDSGSHDGTLEIAKKLGARVFHQDWLGFGKQKNAAVQFANNDWILSLDADEEVSSQLAEEIKAKFSSLKPEVAYQFARKSFYLGRWIMHGGWYPDAQTRLYHRTHHRWDENDVHERIQSKKIERMKNPIQHYVFRNIQHHIETNNRYSSIQAEGHFKKGQKFSYWKLVIKPWVKFIECYFLKLGFMDGYPGFFIAVGAAYSVFIRWGKVKELEANTERG